MKFCFPVTFAVVAFAQTLLAAVISGIRLTNGEEIEENLIISRRRAASEHDHKTDSTYTGIFDDENEVRELRHLEPSKIKTHMKTVLEKLDKNKNGFIEKNELSSKLLETYRRLSAEESDSEFQASDIDENGFVTWEEYIGDTYASNESFEDMTQEENELFLAADVNKDNQLNPEEFRYFYTPEDYSHMKPLIIKGVMSRFDINKDEKITFDEFIGDRNLDYADKWAQAEKSKFQELDVNNDGILEKDEIHSWGSPNNDDVADSEAEHLIFKSDKNKDGILSFDEVLDNYQVFIAPESDSYYIFKDEL